MCKMASSNILLLPPAFINDSKQISAHSYYRVLHGGHATEGMTGLSLHLLHRFKDAGKKKERILGA